MNFDYWLFAKINGWNPGSVVEKFILLLRDKYVWIPFYVFVMAFLFFNFRFRSALKKLLTILATVGLTDFIGNTVFKKGIERLRPCNNPEMEAFILERIPCSSSFSFTSNHAANHFAIATILILLLPDLKPAIRMPLLVWAAAISFAQIFAGVHYPLDVLGGAALGVTVATGVYKLVCSVSYRRKMSR